MRFRTSRRFGPVPLLVLVVLLLLLGLPVLSYLLVLVVRLLRLVLLARSPLLVPLGRWRPSVPLVLLVLVVRLLRLGLLALLALPVLLGLCRLSALLGLPALAARLVLARLCRRLLRLLVVALRFLSLRVRSFPALRRSSAIRWWALWGQLSMSCRTPFLWLVVWVKSILRRRRRTN